MVRRCEHINSLCSSQNEGAVLFDEHKFEEALDFYTSKINTSEHPDKCYANRALCHIKLGQWLDAKKDSMRALELDPDNIKANCYLAVALFELDQLDEAISQIDKTNEMVIQSNNNYGSTVRDLTGRMHRVRLSRRQTQKQDIIKRIKDYIDELVDPLLDHRPERMRLRQEMLDWINKQTVVITPELPDYLTCQVCYDLFDDPVITPTGVTYCRKCIESNIHKVAHVDPVTKGRLEESYLIPNLCIRDAASKFAMEHDWLAYSHVVNN